MKYPQVIDVKILKILQKHVRQLNKIIAGRTIGMLLLILMQSLPFNPFSGRMESKWFVCIFFVGC